MIFARLGASDPTRPANDAPERLPPIEAMNAVQAAVFDNWPEGRRVAGRPNRYGMAIEIWTAPPERINVARRGSYQHKVNIALMDAKAINAWVKTMEKTNAKRLNPLSVDFLAGLADVATMMGPGEFVGFCAVKTTAPATSISTISGFTCCSTAVRRARRYRSTALASSSRPSPVRRRTATSWAPELSFSRGWIGLVSRPLGQRRSTNTPALPWWRETSFIDVDL
jgi:hypothetical protein